MKFAATILALALATTHGLLDEGDHNVQKKDASKGLRGSAVDSSPERAAVGRKLDFYQVPTDPPTPMEPDTIMPTFPNCECPCGPPVRCNLFPGGCESCPPSPMPTPCQKELDVCIAVDESGSVCSKIIGQPKLCEEASVEEGDGSCDVVIDGITTCNGPESDECNYAAPENGGNRCEKFNVVTKSFVAALIEKLQIQIFPEGGNSLRVGAVEYGTDAKVTSVLTNPADATTAVNGIAYSGGFTNLEDSIKKCQETLAGSSAPVIVLVGDGVATTDTSGFRCTGNNAESMVCKTAAKEAADEAKLAGIQIATVHLDDVYLDQVGLKFFEDDIATGGAFEEGGLAFEPLDDEEQALDLAQDVADALAGKAKCISN